MDITRRRAGEPATRRTRAFIIIFALAGALMLSLAAGRTARPAFAQDPNQELDRAVAAGRLDAEVLKELRSQGSAEAIVLFDDTGLLGQSAQRRAARSLAEDDAQELAEKAGAYRALKQQAHAGVPAGGATVLQDYDHFGAQHVRVHNAAALAALLRRPEVRAVRENAANEPALAESLPLVNAPVANATGFTGAGATVAVLDTGVDYTRAAFGSCTAPNTPSGTCRVVYAHDFTAKDDGQRDDSGHGSNVAGIALGVAPSANVLSLDVFGTYYCSPFGVCYGASTSAYDSVILAALDWVVDNKAAYNIVSANLSLGKSNSYFTSSCSGSFAASAFANLRTAGVLPVVAAGNFAFMTNAAGSLVFQNGLSDPACAPGAVSVGAVYDAGSGSFTSGSSKCTDTTVADKITCFSQSGPNLSLLAPGARITAAGSTYSGTSQATPHVAGAIAALRSRCKTATVGQVETALTTTGPALFDARNGVTKRRLDVMAAGVALCVKPSVVDSLGDVGSHSSIKTGPDGRIHISYFDASNFDLKYALYDPIEQSWSRETVDAAGVVGQYTSLAVDASGNPHISYHDYTNGTLKYAKKAGGSWSIITVDGVGTVGWHTAITLDGSGAAHISYYDATNGNLKYAHPVGALAGGNCGPKGLWKCETVDAAGDVGWYTSIARYSGNVLISYYDATNHDLKYAYTSGGAWTVQTIDAAGDTGQYTSMAIGPSGSVNISYYDATNGNLRYARLKGTAGNCGPGNIWVCTTVDSTGNVGLHSAIAVDADGVVHVSYHDETNGDLKYARNASGSWSVMALDTAGDVGEYSSITVDANRVVRISYYDNSTGNLKYIRL